MDLFHSCALAAYFDAMVEGKELDSEYVKRLAYEYYEYELKKDVDAAETLD